MLPLEAWLLGGSALAFGAVVWVLSRHDTRSDRGLEALADALGWDYRPDPPKEQAAQLAALAGTGNPQGGSAYFSGRTTAGPFTFLTGLQVEGHENPCTLIHLRTTTHCEGLWIGPSARFRPIVDHVHHEADRFARRFEVNGPDVERIDHFLDEGTRRVLLRPHNPVRLGWKGNDLVVAFPFEARSEKGVRTLLAYATALALRADQSPADRRVVTDVAVDARPDAVAV